ncbi:MAG: YnbE family lipoprotein [Pseudomonadota bacterium]
MTIARSALILTGTALAVACTHRVEVVAPKEPIRIELAIKIDQEVRVRLEKDIEDLIADNPDLF